MAHVVWTPWRKHGELLTVRSQLYPPKASVEPDRRREACNLMSAWKLRGRLPHAVESTWFLTEAVLTDNIEVNGLSPFAVRASYATAFCRFVTGLVDSEQDSNYKISMYVKAKEIGIPASFVELRHDATHGDLPSLAVLRKAAERSLLWLWNDYWKYLDVRTGNLDDNEIPAFKDGREKFKEDIREVLRTYMEKCTGNNSTSNILAVTETACLEVLRICRGGKSAVTELAAILLEYNMLLPSSKILGQNGDASFTLWDGLLKKLAIHQEPLLTLLTDEMTTRISLSSMMDIRIDIYRESIAIWLVHILATREWAPAVKRAKVNYSTILSTCLQNPNHWTIYLASSILDAPGCREAKAIYKERVSQAAAQQATPLHATIRTISIDNLDGLLPSPRAWLDTAEGIDELAKVPQVVALEDPSPNPEVGGWPNGKGT